MDDAYSIKLSALVDEFALEIIHKPASYDEIEIVTTEVTRPGLALNGFFEMFENRRIQILGKAEHVFLSKLSSEERRNRLYEFLEKRPAAIIISTNNHTFDELLEIAIEFNVPIFRTVETTSVITAALIASLCVHLAPRITTHGVLVEVYGEGVLIIGDSGVGKSETAIELVKRGHRLIADDAVEIKRVSKKTLVGSAPEIIRHYVELRGIGIVDVKRIFGMGAVKQTEKIDLIINLENWIQGKMYDRLGLDNETTNILGIDIPTTTIPVKPGRNLAIILEIAAMNNRQKKMGYNTAEEFNKKLMGKMGLDV